MTWQTELSERARQPERPNSCDEMHLRQYNSTNYLDAAQSYLDIGSLDTNPSGIWSHGQSDDPFWMNPGGQQLWRYYDIHQRKQHYFNLEIAVPLAEFSRMPNGETWSIEMQPEHLLSIELLNSDSMGLCSRYHYNLWEDGGIVAYRRWRNLYFQKLWVLLRLSATWWACMDRCFLLLFALILSDV